MVMVKFQVKITWSMMNVMVKKSKLTATITEIMFSSARPSFYDMTGHINQFAKYTCIQKHVSITCAWLTDSNKRQLTSHADHTVE